MISIPAAWQSLKTRVTIFTLLAFALSLWTIAFYVSRSLTTDMERLLGEQQFAATAMLADNVNREVQERLDSLAVVASTLAPAMPGGAMATQNALESRPVFQRQFNAGTFVIGMDGTAIASFPVSLGRAGVNYLDREHIVAALKKGKSSVSKPAIGKVLNAPMFSMVAPIRDPQGKVIGALVGVTDLGKPNFLDRINDSHLPKTSIVSLISAQHRMTVTSSNKELIQQALPKPGVNPYLDRNIAGFEGHTIVVNVLGQEQLASIKQIPAAQWYLYSGLATAEAFAPVRVMQQRILLAALVLSLFAGSLIWWMLSRQLAPLFVTVKRLAKMAEASENPQLLPITRQDEIGEMIGAFNRLLEIVGRRDVALKASEQNLATTLYSIGDAVIATDAAGFITRMNPTAERMTAWSLADALGQPLPAVFRIVNATTHQPVADPVQRVMAHGQVVGLANHTVLLAKDGQEYQIADSAAPIRDVADKIVGVVLVFSDVTEKYRTEEALRHRQSMMERTESMADLGSFEWDVAADRFTWSPEMFRIFGRDPALGIPDLAGQAGLYTAASAQALFEAIGKAVSDSTPYTLELMSVQADGAQRPCVVKGFPERDANGRVTRVAGLVQDITEHKQAEYRIRESERLREAQHAQALDAQRQAARAALSLMEDAIASKQQAELMSARLNEQLDELRRWQQQTLGRESRILTIKSEVNALLAELGQPPRYPSAADDGQKK